MKDNKLEAITVVFLSDGETWDTLLGCTVAVLTTAGLDHLRGEGEVTLPTSGGNIDTLEPDMIVSEITLKDLVRCWKEHH